ncbi:RNase adapter RapZ [Moraxella sp. ZJ142]|uniref:RNase adapter RapZ n=1 Tax=Moraxella marmotae TaxID=3344520 RepID=UPI0035D45A0D
MQTLSKPSSIVIVSGRSGSGKTSALNILEDFGYYVIDNLPLSLLTDAVSRLTAENSIAKIALGVDARVPGADLSQFPQVHESLVQAYGEHAVKVLYVTANESVLVARFGATRRVHPLMMTGVAGNLPKAIHSEIARLEPIAELADIKIDTSTINTHELKEIIRTQLGVDTIVTVNLLSFGFKYGSPIDADFVFDVRILPNPHWHTDLRVQTGEDLAVQAFFAQYPEVDAMADDIADFLNKWLPQFINNNRHHVTIAIGCTGGKHRSVYISRAVADKLTLPESFKISTKHREKRFWRD